MSLKIYLSEIYLNLVYKFYTWYYVIRGETFEKFYIVHLSLGVLAEVCVVVRESSKSAQFPLSDQRQWILLYVNYGQTWGGWLFVIS